MSALIVDNISIGSNKNINFACQYSRIIDNVEHVFDVTQVGFQNYVVESLRITTDCVRRVVFLFWKPAKDLTSANAHGTLHYDTSFEVSDNKEIRTLTITPKHDIGDIFARSAYLFINIHDSSIFENKFILESSNAESTTAIMKYTQFIPWLTMSNVLTQESMQNFWVSIKRLLFSIKLFDSLVSSKLIKCKISIAYCPLQKAKSLMVLQCHLYQIAYATALKIVISTTCLYLQRLQLHHLLYQQSRPGIQINLHFLFNFNIIICIPDSRHQKMRNLRNFLIQQVEWEVNFIKTVSLLWQTDQLPHQRKEKSVMVSELTINTSSQEKNAARKISKSEL